MTKRHLIITTIILTIQRYTVLGQECKKLGDGEYLFKHKTKEYSQSDFKLIIQGDSFTIINSGQENGKGRLEWWPDNCMFKLNSAQTQRTEKNRLFK